MILRGAGQHFCAGGNLQGLLARRQAGPPAQARMLERLKIKGYVESMRQVIADAVRVPIECVGIKGKTNEGVDAVGRGEAVVAHATALLRRV